MDALGVLLKEEQLQTVENNIIENTLVLESVEPFPGYHGENMPTDIRPESVFLITDKPYSQETIFRTSQHLCCSHNFTADACPAEINFHLTTYHGIRIRNLHQYTHIQEIQQCYMDRGIGFAKFKSIDAQALIRLTKMFSLAHLEDNIFRDVIDDNTYYLALPYHFDWAKFSSTTRNIKNNMDNSNFDCASGFVYFKEMMEFVRIYAQHIHTDKLKTIREKYLEEIARIRDDAM